MEIHLSCIYLPQPPPPLMRRLLEEDAPTELARYKRLCFCPKGFRSLRNETVMNDGDMFNSNSNKVQDFVEQQLKKQ